MEINKIYNGNCLEVLKTFPDNSINCCVTSPPYYGLRDYGTGEQIGLEETPELYIEKLVQVFREVKRVLKDDGTLWLNLGDSYAGSGRGPSKNLNQDYHNISDIQKPFKSDNYKPKDLIGIPWMAAFALRADGWYLRQDIIWSKKNCMPESVTDRCTKSHEYIFLLSKSSKYYYDAGAISEISVRFETDNRSKLGRVPYKSGKSILENSQYAINGVAYSEDGTRNKRSVWTVTTNPYADAHFATYPQTLITDCIKAGCPEFVCNKCGKARERVIEKTKYEPPEGKRFVDESRGDKTRKLSGSDYNKQVKTIGEYLTDCGCGAGFSAGIILDPFMGAGTTALVASKLHRNFVGIELNPEYIKIAENRLRKELGMFNTLNT